MTKKIMKTLAVAMCAVLLVAGSIAGTMAYLTSTAAVSNTFTAGKVKITLDEAKVDEYGVKVGDTRVLTNEYKLVPGREYSKDPTIHVEAGSEPCYLFVKVENGIADIEGANSVNSQMSTDNTWTSVNGSPTIFYYKSIVDASNSQTDIDIKVFETFTIATNADVSKYGDGGLYENAEIVVTAYAVQKDGFDTAQAAWNATFGA